jgi:hypothetical protein
VVLAGGVVVARTLGEARAVIDRLDLDNWLPVSPKTPFRYAKTLPNVLVVGDFVITDPIVSAIKVAADGQELLIARVDLVD